MKKKICLLFTVSMILTACTPAEVSTAEETSSETSEITASPEETKNIMEIVSEAEILGNPSDSVEIYEMSDAVALGYVKEISGYSNVNEETGEYCYPYTYGILEIQKVLKGNMPEEVNFIRMGGIVSWDDYYASLHDAQKEKRDAEMEETPDFVNCHFEDDIEIEEGKTYLMYFAVEDDKYTIQGWQGGLREWNDGKVLNNYTGEWQELSDVIPEDQ